MLDKLLLQVQQLYTSRKLDDALIAAEEALSFANYKNAPEAITEAHLYLALIYQVQGKYKGESQLFVTAFQHIEKAETLDQTGDFAWKLQLAKGEIYLSQKDFQKSADCFQNAFQKAKAQKSLDNKIFSLCALSQLHIQQSQFEKALEYANEGLNYLTPKNRASNDVLKAAVYDQLCKVFIKRQEYSKILEYSKFVLEISQSNKDVERELLALNHIAIFYGVKSDYKTAMQYFLQALDKSKAINYRYQIAQCLINISTIYARLLNFDDALQRYNTVLNDYEDVLDNYTKVILYNNVGNIYRELEQTELGEDYFKKALDLAKKSRYKEMIAHSYAQISRCNIIQKKLTEALENANHAQGIFNESEEKSDQQINLINFGYIYFYDKEFDKAIKIASQGIASAKYAKDDSSEIRGYKLLASIYLERKEFEKAYQYQTIYAKTQEHLAKEHSNKQSLDLEIKYAIKEKQKEIEQLLRENEYQALLLEQSDQIAKQNNQLLQANEDLRQFAYVASHDLKEPLRMIGSYIQLINRRLKDNIDEETDSFFGFVSEGVSRMNNLLDALLRYAIIGKMEEDIELVSIAEVVEMTNFNLRLSIEDSKAEITTENLFEVKAIRSLLIQLFQNLISNAIKFKKENTIPKIHIYGEESPTDYIFNVRDNGIGIAKEYQERIFVIFQRLHARTEFDGTGIGLAICQKIIQKFGGKIWVTSEKGAGATFHISLPKETS